MTTERAQMFVTAARRYAELGYALIRLDGKAPRDAGWQKTQPEVPALVAGEWLVWGEHFNLGVVLGPSGLVELDVDRDDAEAAVRELLGGLPRTPTCRTGSGRLKIFFRDPGGLAKVARDGLELRCGPHQSVLPPSDHPNTGLPYVWLEGREPWSMPLAELPKELVAWARKIRPKAHAAPVGDVIPTGERNEILASLAGTMRNRGMGQEEIHTALLEANRRRCQPPLDESEVARIAKSVARYEPGMQPAGKPGKPSQATTLVRLASDAEFFRTPAGEPFASFRSDGHRETWPVRGRAFKRWLAHRFYTENATAPNAQAIQDALAVLEGKALFEGPELPVAVRLAEHGGGIYLDLANREWEAIEVTPSGWRVVAEPAVRFRRPHGMLPLPAPALKGDLKALSAFVNVARKDDLRLIVAWLLASLRPHGPYPVLGLYGEQGAAKSTTARVLRSLVDPNSAPLRAEPRTGHDLIIAATNSWVVALENVSSLPPWLSEALCRLSTGGGFATRELYTDGEEAIFDAQRPVILNGITELTERGDLLDRALVLHLPRITDAQRRDEERFFAEFQAKRPLILAGLLDALVGALKRIESVELPRLPRMADFARWATAAEPALGWPDGSFMNAYAGNREQANELPLEASLIAQPVRDLGEDGFEGSTTELLAQLERVAGEHVTRRKGWPKAPNILSAELRRLAPNLRAVSVEVEFGQTPGSRSRRVIVIRKIARITDAADATDAPGVDDCVDASMRVDCVDRPQSISPSRAPTASTSVDAVAEAAGDEA